jgi:hypothetical protein
MFKKLKSIFGSSANPQNSFSKKRLRFESIHSDHGFNYLEDIYHRLLAEDKTLEGSEIINNYYKFSDKIQTNTFAAAELEWVTISTICYFRPELTSLLIRRGLLCIVYSWGDKIDSSDVFAFIEQRIFNNDSPYGGLPHDVGVTWLKEILPSQTELVQQVLKEVNEQNNKELEDL